MRLLLFDAIESSVSVPSLIRLSLCCCCCGKVGFLNAVVVTDESDTSGCLVVVDVEDDVDDDVGVGFAPFGSFGIGCLLAVVGMLGLERRDVVTLGLVNCLATFEYVGFVT